MTTTLTFAPWMMMKEKCIILPWLAASQQPGSFVLIMKVQGSSVKLRLLPNTSDSRVECGVSIEAALHCLDIGGSYSLAWICKMATRRPLMTTSGLVSSAECEAYNFSLLWTLRLTIVHYVTPPLIILTHLVSPWPIQNNSPEWNQCFDCESITIILCASQHIFMKW